MCPHDHIKRRKPKYLCDHHIALSLDSVKDVSCLTASVDQTKIKSVNISHRNPTALPVDQIIYLFDSVGSLPNLQHFRVHFLGHMTAQFSAVAAALKQAHQLKQLELNLFDLDAGTEDTNEFYSFTESLSAHPSLKEFKLSFSRLSSRDVRLNSIVQALRTVPTLEKLQIFLKPSIALNPNAPSARLKISLSDLLCGVSNLKIFKIVGVKLQLANVIMMAKLLESNDSVEYLSLCGCGIDSNCAIHIAQMLRANSTLQKLDLSWNKVDDTGCIAIVKALEENSTLQSLYLHKDKGVSQKSYEAVECMLQRNFSIKDLWINLDEEGIREKVHFYLNLNTAGKRHILKQLDSTPDEWYDVLASHQNDLSTLFYYVFMNPSVFNC